jgi:acyl-CoA reductase-like NAD-dependent aldehyde dehydrogenase
MLYVQDEIAEELTAMLFGAMDELVIGDPADPATEVGPLATAAQREHIEEVVARSREAGARILAGGARPRGISQGFYYLPTIVDCDSADIPSVEEELFGPVLSVLGFEDEAGALRLANASRYGLAAGVFTRDLTRAHRLVRDIRAGIVWVNTYRAVSPIAPFGGFGLSGYGREAGMESMLDYTRAKTAWLRTADDPIPDPFVMR